MTEKDLQKQVNDLKAEIKRLQKNTLGLNFEDKPEDVVALCQSNVPVLKQVKKNKIVSKGCVGDNLLIEGENYHALSVLNYTHKNKIDLIFIDPPYNTGHDSFIYNDKFVDAEDGYRHSKWLSFMKKRLELARELLSDKGLIFISIDDNEQAHLRILCDSIFGEKNFIATTVWQHSIQGKNDAKKFSLHHNYVHIYSKSDSFEIKKIEREDKHNVNYSNPDQDPRGPWRSGDVRSPNYRANLKYDLNTPSRKIILAPAKGWRWSHETMMEKILHGEIIFSPNEDKIIRKIYLNDQDGRVPETIWFAEDVGTTREASQELKSIFSNENFKFETPKPSRLVKFILKIGSDENSTILDFFAGSGTTGHAVLELNKEDSGNRKFILVTNNGDEKSEHKIATDICYPRIKKVITGYGGNDPIPANLTYYKTDLVDVENLHKISDEARIKVTYQAGEMIGVRENTLNEIEKNDWWQLFESENKVTAIYFKEDKSKLNELITKLEKLKKQAALYIFSWGKNENKGEYSNDQIRVEDIPEPILEVYKEINRL